MTKIDILEGQPHLIQEAIDEYKYQPDLTDKLDKHGPGDYTHETLLEIVLWKLNRYPQFDETIIERINDLRKDCTDEKAKVLLKDLMGIVGVDLPMASTLLRFARPDKFQIIDKRAYRFLMAKKNELKLSTIADKKVELYFAYLETLRESCLKYDIPFDTSDRILYQLDKIKNADIPLTPQAKNKQAG